MPKVSKKAAKKIAVAKKAGRPKGETDEPAKFSCQLVESIPKVMYGLKESAYNDLVSQLGKLKEGKNSVIVPQNYTRIVGRIAKTEFPEYALNYHHNEEKGLTSVWRKK